MYIPSYPINQGWMCPTCGRVYAPWVFSCINCPPLQIAGFTTTDPVDTTTTVPTNNPSSDTTGTV